MNGTYRSMTTMLALAMVGLGIVMFVIGVIHGGSAGILIGLLFVAAGVGRLWMLRKRNYG